MNIKNKKVYTAEPCRLRESILEESNIDPVPSNKFAAAHYTYAYATSESEDLDLDEIDLAESREIIQVRLGAKLFPNVVSRYTQDIKKGDIFPSPILIVRTSDKGIKYYVADGNHTLAAIKEAGYTHIRGYYKFSHPYDWIVAGRINAVTNGIGEDEKERLYRAVNDWFALQEHCDIESQSMPTKRAFAQSSRVDEKKFAKAVKMRESQQKLNEFGINGSAIESSQSLDHISDIFNVDRQAGMKFGRMVVSYCIPPTRTKEIRDGFLDPEKNGEEKTTFLEEQENHWKHFTANGSSKTKRKNRTRRSSEEMFKSGILSLKGRLPALNVEKLKKMLSKDEAFSEAHQKVKEFFNSNTF